MDGLEKKLYSSDSAKPKYTRRDFLKGVVIFGLAVAGVKVGGDYLGRAVFPRYERPKETVDPEVEARRKLASENFKYLAQRIGGDGAWMIKELSEKNSNFFDLQMDKLSKDYIEQNFRRYDNGPVIVGGSEETYKRIEAALELGKEKIPREYEEAMDLVKIIRIYKNEKEAGYPGMGVITTRYQKYGSIGVVENTIPVVENSLGFLNFVEGILCHEKNHIKYPDYIEKQVIEEGIPCQKKLGIIQ